MRRVVSKARDTWHRSRRRLAVIRRCRTPLVILTAVFGLAGLVRAGGMATYQLVNTGDANASPVTQVVAEIIPAGAVSPPSPNVDPLTILSGSTGFNKSNLIDFLGNGTLNTGNPLQVLKLQFDGSGLAKGGVVNFALNLDPSYTGPPPTLELAPGTTGVSLLSFTPPVTSGAGGSGGGTTPPLAGGGSGGGTNSVPEPISLALWSVAAGLGLLRARAFRRARQVADL
jgi:hypothetical protein